jgi:hypothetical protein
MKIVEIKTALKLSDDEKEILYEASKILEELYEEDKNNRIFYKIVEESGCDELSDFNDVSYILNLLYELDTLLINAD